MYSCTFWRGGHLIKIKRNPQSPFEKGGKENVDTAPKFGMTSRNYLTRSIASFRLMMTVLIMHRQECLYYFFKVPPFKGRDLGWGGWWSFISNADAASSAAWQSKKLIRSFSLLEDVGIEQKKDAHYSASLQINHSAMLLFNYFTLVSVKVCFS